MITINDLLIPKDSSYQCCQHKHGGPIEGPYSQGPDICISRACIKLPTHAPNLFCYQHAMVHLRRDLENSTRRQQVSRDQGSRGGPGSWGASIALRSSYSDIETIREIIQLLESSPIKK
jgi:hypothetical protein